MGATVAIVLLVILLLKLVNPTPLPESSVQHFYIVSGASLLAAAVAAILALTTVQIGLYRVLLLCLGFASMGGIFAVHGLLTPGVVVPDRLEVSAYRVVGISAYFSLAVPAVFFAVGFAPGMAWLERRLPFWPAGWLVALTAVALVAYAAIAFLGTGFLSATVLADASFKTAATIATIALLLFAALQQARLYQTTGLAGQADLIFAFVLLAEASVAMAAFAIWTLGWWLYHLLMLTAVCFALRALIVERLRRASFKESVEAALELGSEIPGSPR